MNAFWRSQREREEQNFPADAMRYDATVRNIELVGEAATHVPESVRRDHPEIPWRMVIATRNQLIHGYVGVDDGAMGVSTR